MLAFFIALGIFLLLLAVFHLFCFHFIFHRGREHEGLPRYAGPYLKEIEQSRRAFATKKAEPCHIKASDGTALYGELFLNGQSQNTIILFHGYRSSGRRDFGAALPFYEDLGLNILLVHQRAHGQSGGRFITYGVKERLDCRAWIDFVNRRLPGGKIMLGGLSMGCTTVLMACGLQLPENVKGVVADCGFTTPRAIIQKVARQRHLPPFLFLPTVSLLCRWIAGFNLNGASTVTAMQQNTVPVFFVHGKADTFVPAEMTEENYKACKAPKQLLLVEGAEHGISFLVDRPTVSAALQRFVQTSLQTQPE